MSGETCPYCGCLGHEDTPRSEFWVVLSECSSKGESSLAYWGPYNTALEARNSGMFNDVGEAIIELEAAAPATVMAFRPVKAGQRPAELKKGPVTRAEP